MGNSTGYELLELACFITITVVQCFPSSLSLSLGGRQRKECRVEEDRERERERCLLRKKSNKGVHLSSAPTSPTVTPHMKAWSEEIPFRSDPTAKRRHLHSKTLYSFFFFLLLRRWKEKEEERRRVQDYAHRIGIGPPAGTLKHQREKTEKKKKKNKKTTEGGKRKEQSRRTTAMMNNSREPSVSSLLSFSFSLSLSVFSVSFQK